ncbi:glycosyltransferase family 2 protein [Bacillus cereus group sp. Bce040]|uniref:glycosyltransferase family 2 protein n=1 Tax=Bacillus cereus group sp. Bce040 TaxID=3445229 RepID=UPI003F2003B8
MGPKLNITVITVTYGDRWDYLEKNLLSLEGIDLIENVIVVNNGANYNLDKKLNRFKKCLLVDLNRNSGSAVGFSHGVKKFLEIKRESDSLQDEKDWVLFLDDDNYIKEIEINALRELLSNSYKEGKGEAFFCNRLSRSKHYSNYQPIKYNGFLSFNCFKSKPVSNISTLELLPYSGLLLTKEMINTIGLPNEAFYLYCDDYDYSFRLVKNHIVTRMIDTCVIDDVEVSWNQENENFAVSVVTGNPLKVYYSVRNRVNLEKNNMISNYFAYFSNAILFILYVIYKNIKCRTKIKFKSIYALMLGIFDGLRGKLGVHKKYTLK